ncbi:MAG: hypothetical protein A2Y15_01535 [Clostridiales bacterium GWF2_36_10]|nr:MAG: hypothetical protein A2Y15_01535 [Clostridiales bacterium GWF2_36_10]HAN22130.1 hypothetical protein [Clostridiales bacterium]
MNLSEIINSLPCMYNNLLVEKRPILLYGMGDGADKIYTELNKRGINIRGVFASEGFVRGQNFLDFTVMSLEDAEEKYGDFVAVLCFALEGKKSEILALLRKKHTLYSPNLPVYGDGVFNKEYILSNIDKLQRLYDCLADEMSKKIFISLLKYNITGEIDYLFENKNTFIYPQGFFNHNKRHIDVGAYNGDTVLEFTSYNNEYSDIVAFEPDKINYRKLEKNTAHLRNIICENAAVFSHGGSGGFIGKGNRASFINNEIYGDLRIVSIDSYCNQQYINDNGIPVGSIKIDAEGADKQVLSGAVNTIYKHCPDIMVALYHRSTDLIDLPLLIRSYDYNYKLFLRKKDYVPAWDVFLLALY